MSPLCSAIAAVVLGAGDPAPQDLIFLLPERIFCVRLLIERDGRSYSDSWGDYLVDVFESLDADGDYDLDYREFGKGDLETLRRRSAETGFTLPSELSFLDLDRNPKDGAVSFSEFLETLGASGCQVRGADPSAQIVGRDALFERLDAGGAKRIERTRLASADDHLRWLDADDNELYSLSELDAMFDPFGRRRAFAASPAGRPAPETSWLLAPAFGAALEPIAERVVERYGDSARSVLRVDAEGGTPSPQEVARALTRRPPDLVVRVSLWSDPEQGASASPVPPDQERSLQGASIRERSDDRLTITMSGLDIDISARRRLRPGELAVRRQQRTQTFKQADGDDNDYLDPREAGRFGLSRQFPKMDVDRNKQVYLEEMLAWYDRQIESERRRIDVAVGGQGSSLFEIVDANDDRFLSRRELMDLEGIASGWDRDGDGQLADDEIPRRYQVTIGEGDAASSGRQTFVDPVGARARPARDSGSAVPDWFVRMDRNGDRELSRREFLGDAADFVRLDADGDSLLSANEALPLEK